MSLVIPPVLLPLAGLALLLVTAFLGRPRRSVVRGAHATANDALSKGMPKGMSLASLITLFWQLFLLAFLALWVLRGYVPLRLRQLAVVVAVFVAGGFAALMRDRLFAWLDSSVDEGETSLAASVESFLRVMPLLVATVLTVLALEVPWNERFLQVPPYYIALEFGLILLLMLCAYFLTQRTGIGPQLVIAFWTWVGVMQHFVVNFKYSSIMPSDIFGLATAIDVAGGFEYVLTGSCFRGICLGAAAIAVVAYARPILRDGRGAAARFVVNLVLAALVGGIFVASVTMVDFERQLGLAKSYWSAFLVYKEQGFLPSFVVMAQDLTIDMPEGYSEKRARAVQDELAARYESGRGSSEARLLAEKQFDEERPCVVVVMNETFSDLSILDGLHANYKGPKYFSKGMKGELAHGALGVSTLGGGTCNTEFEMLTGISIGYVGMGKYPYSQYDFNGVDTMPRAFSKMGYATTAIHPAIAANWHRDYAYAQMGFDRFLDLDSFVDPPLFHGLPTDRSTYELVLETLADESAPQFIFDVTIQNHAGYDQNNIPDWLLDAYAPEGVEDKDLEAELNEFLTCIDASDNDLEWFISELGKLDRKVVLVFFGDHQPALSANYNDLFYENEDEVPHMARIYQTVYSVWTNYDVAGWDKKAVRDAIGADTLAALTLDLVGAPLSTYQKAQLGLHEELQVISGIGYQDSTGAWWAIDSDGPYASLWNDVVQLDYLAFGSKV